MVISENLKLIPFSETKEEVDLWDGFAANHPEGRFCHLSGYKKVVEKSYNYKPYYYILKKNNSIVGLIPFFVCNSIMLGKKLISQPFSEYGGFLLTDLKNEEYKEVFENIRKIMRQAKVETAEIHGGFGIPEAQRNEYMIPIAPHYRAVLKLDTTVEIMFNERIDRMVRKAVRKAERSQVKCYEKSDQDMIKDCFYPLFLKSMKRLGVPAHPLSYYIGLLEHLGNNIKIFWAEYSGKIVAALLGFTVGRGIHIINSVSDPVHWDKRPNDLCHWRFIKWGIENFYEYFDMGSVRYEGQMKFKNKWGVELKEFNYYLLKIDPRYGKSSGDLFESSSKSMRFLSAVWSKCVPLSLTRYIGPLVRRQLAR